MSDQQISLKPALTTAQVSDDTKIVPWVVGATGFINKATVAQIKAVFGTQKFKYVATGAEGTTLTIPTIAAMNVLAIFREGACMYEVSATPDSVEFIWDGTNITLGLGVTGAGERFLILYRYL